MGEGVGEERREGGGIGAHHSLGWLAATGGEAQLVGLLPHGGAGMDRRDGLSSGHVGETDGGGDR